MLRVAVIWVQIMVKIQLHIAAQRPHIVNGFRFFFRSLWFSIFFISVFAAIFFLLKSVFFYIILQMRNCAAYFVNMYTVCAWVTYIKHTYTRTYFMHCRVHRPRILFLFRMHAYFMCMLIFFPSISFYFQIHAEITVSQPLEVFFVQQSNDADLFFVFFFYLSFFLFGVSADFRSIIRYAFYTVFSEFSTSNTLP